MLVRLGNVWVNPDKAAAVFTSEDGKTLVLAERRLLFPNISADDCAVIINNSGQSFGGEDETPKKD